MSQWSDDRLTERFAGVERRLSRVDGTADSIVQLRADVAVLKEDVAEIKVGTASVTKLLTSLLVAIIVTLLGALGTALVTLGGV